MNIQCPACETTYDVSGRPAGTMVTCHCGETFGFQRPAPAALSMQCPGCGAGADPGDQRCQYCDKALRSVCCPNCFTLMFDGGKHCNQCGTRVVAPAVVVHRSGGTELPCPRCSAGLTANLIDNQLFDRCDRCGGIWVHHVAIQELLEKPGKHTVQTWLQKLPEPAKRTDSNHAAGQCPDCERAMQQYRTPKNKQMVIDVCGMHGIWFDHREIRAIVGEPRVSGRQSKNRRQYNRVRNRSQFAEFLDDTDDWWPWEALEDLLDFIKDLFD